jgi:hypothetical protein
MKKMGESQIIQFFSSALSDKLQRTLGEECKFVLGNFSGSQDRKFADFFAGTDSVNVLIEFKELKSEHIDEIRKPFRERLCRTLTTEIAFLSRACHFIGWGVEGRDLSVQLNPYVDLVCRLWNQIRHLLVPIEYSHNSFIDSFVKGTLGVGHEDFVRYIEHLNATAGEGGSGGDVPFRSILYSRDDNGQMKGTRFENLRELSELIRLRPIDRPRPTYRP